MYYNYYFFVKILYLLTLYTKGFNIYVYYFNLKWRKYVKQKNFKNIYRIKLKNYIDNIIYDLTKNSFLLKFKSEQK